MKKSKGKKLGEYTKGEEVERNRANVVGVVKPLRQQGKWRGKPDLVG